MQTNQVGADATRAGAFGGGRHGLVEALTNAEALKTSGDLSAALREQGWNTAATLSGQDIANDMAANQFNAAARNATNQFNAANRTGISQFNAGQQQARDFNRAQLELNKAAGLGDIAGRGQALGQLGYTLGGQTAQQQMAAGSAQQALAQMILGGANEQFMKNANQPQNMLDIMLSALGMSPLNNAKTQTSSYTPGLYDYIALAAGLGSATWGGGR